LDQNPPFHYFSLKQKIIPTTGHHRHSPMPELGVATTGPCGHSPVAGGGRAAPSHWEVAARRFPAWSSVGDVWVGDGWELRVFFFCFLFFVFQTKKVKKKKD
jgi:hypothetical protein